MERITLFCATMNVDWPVNTGPYEPEALHEKMNGSRVLSKLYFEMQIDIPRSVVDSCNFIEP